MHDFLMAEDSELWDIILDGPFVPMIEEKDGEITKLFQSLDTNTMKLTRRRLKGDTKQRSFLSVV